MQPATKPGNLRLRILFRRESDGAYSVAIPALPGCFSQGAIWAEAEANIREAMAAWLEVANARDPFKAEAGAAKSFEELPP